MHLRTFSRPHNGIEVLDQVYPTRREDARLVNYFRSSNSDVGLRNNSAPCKSVNYFVMYSTAVGRFYPWTRWRNFDGLVDVVHQSRLSTVLGHPHNDDRYEC